MALTAPLEDAGHSVEERAQAMLQYIREQIGAISDLEHSRPKAALQAAFCLSPGLTNSREYPSMTARLKYATQAGDFGEGAGPEAGKRNWRRGIKLLARLVEENAAELVGPAGWVKTGPPSGFQPVHVRRLVVTYYLTGQAVTDVVTERTIEAMEDGVDKYVVRDYVQGDGDAEIEVGALLNCRKIRQLPVDLGPGFVAVKAEMLLPRAYDKGQLCTFATRVTRRRLKDPTTWQEIQVTSHGITSLSMRVQFDKDVELPVRCWHFGAMPDLGRLEPPQPGEDRDVEISRFGFAQYHFGTGHVAAKYGMVWRWR